MEKEQTKKVGGGREGGGYGPKKEREGWCASEDEGRARGGGRKTRIRYWHTALRLYERVNDSIRSLWVPGTTSTPSR